MADDKDTKATIEQLDETLLEDDGSDLTDDVREAWEKLASEEPAEGDSEATATKAKVEDDKTEDEGTDKESDAAASSGDKPDQKAADDDTGKDAAPEGEDGEETEDAEPQEDDATAQAAIEPPARLSEEHKERFRSLPHDAQEFLRDRHQEMEADHTRKTQETAEARKAADGLNSAVEPYRAHIASLNTTPEQAVHVLLSWDHALRTAPADQKAARFAQLAKHYGVDLEGLADVTSDDETTVSPELAEVRQGIVRVNQRFDAAAAQENAAKAEDANVLIATFAEARDDAGNLAHPHFEAVKVAMGVNMGADPNLTMQEAYERATWADPAVRTALQAEQTKAAAAETERKRADVKAKETKARNEKAKQARKAGVGVKPGSEPTDSGDDSGSLDLREQVKQNFERLSSSA